MKPTELTRDRLPCVTLDLASERGKLIEQAGNLFGEKEKISNANKSLALVLHDLEIAPLNPEQVRKYKTSKISRTRLYTESEKMLLILATALLFFPFYAMAHIYRVGEPKTSTLVEMAGVLGLIVASVLYLGAFDVATSTRYRERKWGTSSLINYGLYKIPDFVLARAVTLKQALPDANFKIEYLNETIESITIEHDPFLIIEHRGDKAWLDVWDEGDFERTI